jgi:hypothetical protein
VKKKHRPLKVKLLDETIKTVMIDESEPVRFHLPAQFFFKIKRNTNK